MSMLDQVTTGRTIRPPRIVIHGRGGVGKTTFGASTPNPIFLPAEEGLGTLDVPHVPIPTSYAEILETITDLQRQEHVYRTLVIDTIDHVEPLVWEEMCRRMSEGGRKTYEHVEDFGYQKGYLFADREWTQLFHALDAIRRDPGMMIVVLSHNESKTFEDPVIGPYDRVTPKLHKRANALLYEWADIVGYLEIQRATIEKEGAKSRKVRTSATTGTRELFLEDTGAFIAKNRYGLPIRIEVPQANPYTPLREALKSALGVQKQEAA